VTWLDSNRRSPWQTRHGVGDCLPRNPLFDRRQEQGLRRPRPLPCRHRLFGRHARQRQQRAAQPRPELPGDAEPQHRRTDPSSWNHLHREGARLCCRRRGRQQRGRRQQRL